MMLEGKGVATPHTLKDFCSPLLFGVLLGVAGFHVIVLVACG